MKRGTSRLRRSAFKNTRKRNPEAADYTIVKRRSGGGCEVVLPWDMLDGRAVRCSRRAMDVHHIVKRSHGGRGLGPRNLIHICRYHHDMTDAATTQISADPPEHRLGRLMIEPMPTTFRCWLKTS